MKSDQTNPSLGASSLRWNDGGEACSIAGEASTTSAGYLLLGSSGTADHPPGLFRIIDRHARLYQSTTQIGDKPRLLPRLVGPVRVREQMVHLARNVSPTVALSEATLHRRAIEQVAPPSILVDEMHHVIHLRTIRCLLWRLGTFRF